MTGRSTDAAGERMTKGTTLNTFIVTARWEFVWRKETHMVRKFEGREITKLLDVLVGNTCPVADSEIDRQINENLMVLIDVTNWCLDGVYSAASNRKSPYGSQMIVGERAYATMLEWKKWLEEREEELA